MSDIAIPDEPLKYKRKYSLATVIAGVNWE